MGTVEVAQLHSRPLKIGRGNIKIREYEWAYMKSRFLVILIVLSVVHVPVASSQIPTAAISLSCEPETITITHLYDFEESLVFSPSVENHLICTLSNPTAYVEVVEISIQVPESNELVSFEYEEQQEVGGGQDKQFTSILVVTEGLESAYDAGYQISSETCIYFQFNSQGRVDITIKSINLPTSDEMKSNAILEKARYAPGSPFLPPEERNKGLPPPAVE